MGKYIRKSTRQTWSKDSMRAAMKAVTDNNLSTNSAAKQHLIPEPTLRRYLKKHSDENFPRNAGRFKPTFTDNQLLELKDYITQIDQRAFGLTKKQFSSIVFDYAVHHGAAHRFNTNKKKAGRAFCEEFMKKFKISLRTPESTSVARLMAFNKENVNKFFTALKEVKQKHGFSANCIYNCDETGISTVPTKTPKILTPTGTRRVVKLSSGERGTNVTALCCISATGTYIPPLLIFPRVRMQPSYLNGAPPGTIGLAHESGWMTTENFTKFLQHHVTPGKDKPVLLLMDNHATHISLDSINLCREHHITLLGFPPHTSHRMQPLDVSFYGPLKTAYSIVCDDFLTSNPGTTIRLQEIGSLFGKAYLKAATVANAVNGFKATGIEPLDSDVFSEIDFAPANTTDKPPVTTPSTTPQSVIPEVLSKSGLSTDVPTIDGDLDAAPSTLVQLIPSTSMISPVENASSSLTFTTKQFYSKFTGLPPLPVAEVKITKQRKSKVPSLIISSTPVKTALERVAEEKLEKQRKQIERNEKKKKVNELKQDKMQQQKIKKQQNKAKIQEKKRKKQKIQEKESAVAAVKRKINFSSDSSDSSVTVEFIDSDDDNDPLIVENEKNCIICDDAGKDNELWFQCIKCLQWAHADCTGLDQKEAKRKLWFCDFCS